MHHFLLTHQFGQCHVNADVMTFRANGAMLFEEPVDANKAGLGLLRVGLGRRRSVE